MPTALGRLTSLHTLSVRKNRFYSLPAWLCMLPALETLLVDGNPFLEPWATLIGPILDNGGITQQQQDVYPGSSTPVVPLTPLAAEHDPEHHHAESGPPVAAPTPFSNNFLSDLQGLPISNQLGIDDSIAAAIVANGHDQDQDPPLRRSFSNPQTLRRPSEYDSGYGYGDLSINVGSRPPSEAHHEPLSPTLRSSKFGTGSLPSHPSSSSRPGSSGGSGGRLRLEPVRPPPPIPTHAPHVPHPGIPEKHQKKEKSRERDKEKEKEKAADMVGSYLFALDSTFVGGSGSGGGGGDGSSSSRKGTGSKSSYEERSSNAKSNGPTASMSSVQTSSAGTQRQPGIRRMKSADELSRMGGGGGGLGGPTASAYYGSGTGPGSGSAFGSGAGASSKPLGSAPLLPHIAGITDEHQELPGRRFESLPRSGPTRERSRVPLTVFADASVSITPPSRRPGADDAPELRPSSLMTPSLSSSGLPRPPSRSMHINHSIPLSPTEVGAGGDKSGKKWGFLKKMSMGRMRSGSSPKEQAQHAQQHHQQQQYSSSTVGAPGLPNRQPIVRAHTTAGRSTSPLPPRHHNDQGSVRGRPEPTHSTSAPLPRAVSSGSIAVGEDGALHRSSVAASADTTSPIDWPRTPKCHRSCLPRHFEGAEWPFQSQGGACLCGT